MEKFYDHLILEERRISLILNRNVEMLPLTSSEQKRFDDATHWTRCHKKFTPRNWRVAHHNHFNGLFMDPLCNNCNLQCKSAKRGYLTDGEDKSEVRFFIPVVFHNLHNYDMHHIVKFFNKRLVAKTNKTGNTSYDNINVIAQNSEKFISIEILGKRFIDSFQFFEHEFGFTCSEFEIVV